MTNPDNATFGPSSDAPAPPRETVAELDARCCELALENDRLRAASPAQEATPPRCKAACRIKGEAYLWECTIGLRHACAHCAGTHGNFLVWDDDGFTINPFDIEIVRLSDGSAPRAAPTPEASTEPEAEDVCSRCGIRESRHRLEAHDFLSTQCPAAPAREASSAPEPDDEQTTREEMCVEAAHQMLAWCEREGESLSMAVRHCRFTSLDLKRVLQRVAALTAEREQDRSHIAQLRAELDVAAASRALTAERGARGQGQQHSQQD